jgi:hypothetical protein
MSTRNFSRNSEATNHAVKVCFGFNFIFAS